MTELDPCNPGVPNGPTDPSFSEMAPGAPCPRDIIPMKDQTAAAITIYVRDR